MIAAALLAASTAWAGPGDHITVGDSTVIVPAVQTGIEYRANSYLSVGALAGPSVQDTRPADRAVPSVNYLLRPMLNIKVDTSKVRFDFDGRYELRKWFDPDLAANLDRFSDFAVSSRLDILRKGPFGLALRYDGTLRNRESDNQWRGNALLTQLRNDVGGSTIFRIGPDFDIEAGMDWSRHTYRVPGADVQRALDTRDTYAPILNLHWRFFPNTAFVVETSYQHNDWAINWIPTNETVGPTENGPGAVRSYGDFLAKPNSDFFKAMTGVRGRVTKHLIVGLTAGWGMGRYLPKTVADESDAAPGIGTEANPDAAGFSANVKGIDGLLVMFRTQLDLGFDEQKRFGQALDFLYRKDFQDSFFTNYVAQNHLRIGLQSRWGRYLKSSVSFGPRFEEYRGEVNRRDIYWRLDGGLTVSPTRYLSFDLGAAWAQRASTQTDIQYDNVQAWFTAGFTY